MSRDVHQRDNVIFVRPSFYDYMVIIFTKTTDFSLFQSECKKEWGEEALKDNTAAEVGERRLFRRRSFHRCRRVIFPEYHHIVSLSLSLSARTPFLISRGFIGPQAGNRREGRKSRGHPRSNLYGQQSFRLEGHLLLGGQLIIDLLFPLSIYIYFPSAVVVVREIPWWLPS